MFDCLKALYFSLDSLIYISRSISHLVPFLSSSYPLLLLPSSPQGVTSTLALLITSLLFLLPLPHPPTPDPFIPLPIHLSSSSLLLNPRPPLSQAQAPHMALLALLSAFVCAGATAVVIVEL